MMKYLVVLLLVMGGWVTYARQNEVVEDGLVRIGYCPTMAKLETRQLDGSEMIVGETSASVLEMLKKGEIEVAVVGRKIKPDELGEGWGEVAEDGLTLVSKKGGLIEEEALPSLTIHTLADTKVTEELGFGAGQINRYEQMNEVWAAIGEEAGLIPWTEVDYERVELLIPVDEKGDKVSQFRARHMYFSHENEGELRKLYSRLLERELESGPVKYLGGLGFRTTWAGLVQVHPEMTLTHETSYFYYQEQVSPAVLAKINNAILLEGI